ncbi:hypothetical protein BC830DRAFT_1139637 [Chytriomyces sp. MP71]|nr:hypothetical protein BC830DRAFT_1139637 [Chytriomyces sp. MP71]
MNSYGILNLSVGAVCVGVLGAYHVWLIHIVRTQPEKTVYGLNLHSRKAWVAAIMKGKKDILAVQSLRNLIMAASILASTCVAIIFGFIAFLATVVSHPDTVNGSINPLGSQFGFVLDELFGAKVMGLLVIFCIAFFCFAQAMRFYNHVGMVININLSEKELEEYLHLSPSDSDSDGRDSLETEPETHSIIQINDSGFAVSKPSDIPNAPPTSIPDFNSSIHQAPNRALHLPDIRSLTPSLSLKLKPTSPTPQSPSRRRRERNLAVHSCSANIDFVARLLNRGSTYYTLGMRGYYLAFPVMAYLWGPWALLGTTLLLTGILRVVDFNTDLVSPAERRAAEAAKRREERVERRLAGQGVDERPKRRYVARRSTLVNECHPVVKDDEALDL